MGRHAIKKIRTNNPKKELEIILSLIAYLRTNSLSKSNMDEIAAGLNRSKATIYKYFKSKEQMIDALITYKIEKISAFVIILNNKNILFLERLEESFNLLEKHIIDISNDFLDDLKLSFPKVYAKIELLIQLAVNQLSNYYEEGMDLGIFNKLNAKMLSQNDFVFFRTLTDPQYLKDNNLTMSEAFKDFYQIRCLGIIAKK
jgi:AcrR family transcriptional regulator